MERSAWTDERLDEKMSAVDHGFLGLHDALGEIRDEVRGLRSDLGAELRALRSDFNAEIRALRTDLAGETRALRSEVAEVRSDVSTLKDRLLQGGLALIAVLITAVIALTVG